MKIQWKTLLICVAVPLLVGALSGFISSGAMDSFAEVVKPPLSPPGWLFPIVWSILFVLMGIASYLVVTSNASAVQVSDAIKIYGLQLFFNFFWSIWFFNLRLYFFSFLWLVILWVLILKTALRFREISKPAGYLLLPYLLWVTFAGYLNLGIAFLN